MKFKIGDLVMPGVMGNVPVFSHLPLVSTKLVGFVKEGTIAVIVGIPDKDHAIITNGLIFGIAVIGALVKL